MMEPTTEEFGIVREMAAAGASLFLFDGALRGHAFIWPLNGWQGRTIMPLQAERLVMMGVTQESPGLGVRARRFSLSRLGVELGRTSARFPASDAFSYAKQVAA